MAAQNGHADVVDLLISKKADVSRCDMYGRNCLDLAVVNDHQWVFNRNAKRNLRNPSKLVVLDLSFIQITFKHVPP